ncbi:MAG: NAD(P)-dependent alcohol dehydrogenase [Anaerolineaceae bacterium]|nr:NAD(P)-dependent alcohol dehydrogenase [Anaerolineaceae bacterium]
MKAIVQLAQGSADGLRLQEVEKPTPKANEVLVQVHAATVTAGDVVMRKLPRLVYPVLALMGLKRKSIPGHEFAGVVEAVGDDVTRFRAGDHVFGTTTGLRVGANAEYVCVPETSKSGVIAEKPANISYEQAAALPVGGMTALQILRKANIQHGQRALIYGASGSVGSYAVQLAKYFGADVTGVCSAANFEMVQSLGADSVIDYASGDFTHNTQTYDVIFDAVGKTSQKKLKNVLAENGVYLSVKGSTSEKLEYLSFLGELAEKGQIKPYIDARYPLEQTPAAHRYVETGRKKGNVVITVVNS